MLATLVVWAYYQTIWADAFFCITICNKYLKKLLMI